MWRYMSDKEQDQNVLITCCSRYGKKLLGKLCWTSGVQQLKPSL